LTVLCCAGVFSLLAGVAQAQSVSISPGYTTIGVNGTVQYAATVTGLSNTAVTWSVSGVNGGNAQNGTISTAGLYKAPATIPANGITVGALASDGKTSSEVYVNVAPPGPSITAVSPNPVPVGQYTVTLTGKGFQSGATVRNGNINLSTTYVNATTLTANGYQGTTAAGVFQVENPGSLWGPALSVPFSGSSGGGSTTQTISPTSASVKLGATQQFTSSGATSWSATAGTISSSGLYTAPATMPASSAVTVTAKGPNGSAAASVTLVSGAVQAVTPASATLALGATQQFTSAGATSWTASAGSISSAGLYTAPATLPSSAAVTITANGPNGAGHASVTLIPPTPVITSAGSGPLPLGSFSATLTGTGFTSQSVAKLNGSALGTTYGSATTLKISGYASASGSASLTVSNLSVTSQPFTVQVGVANAQVSAATARRFLQQAAFGPTPNDAAHVQTIGLQPWLTEQYGMAQVSTYSGITSSQGGMPAHFLTMAVSNPDQLRQRVAFALSQIFVTSFEKLIWNDNMTLFQDMLLADAFTNYRQIMADVTLSPAMGQYLDMANNAKADPQAGSVANENYARELMQLFTIGTNMLNSDGSIQYDKNNLPIPTYSQFTVTEFARVFTGWTYAPASGQAVEWNSYISSNGPMVPYEAQHDEGSKTLLNGATSPGGAAQQDLNAALDNIFNHPNVGPFVGKQLIQHLVKSNPSAAYISRVAAAFNNNGKGVRGDMQAVITAVLLDPEARANDAGSADQASDGHLQEPALFIAGMVRAFGGQMTDQNYYSSELANLGQDLFNPASVFNYYSPGYQVPGTTLTGGEFEIHTPNNAIVRDNEVSNLMFSAYQKPVQTYGPGTTVDLTPFVQLASTPATLVSALDLTLTRGVMPSAMKSAIVSAVTADASNGSVHQVQTACFLILSSSYYNVWH